MVQKKASGTWLLGAFFISVLASGTASKSHFSDFLIFDDDAAGLQKVADVRPDAFMALPDSALHEIFDYLFLKYQREQTRNWVKQVYLGAGCSLVRKEPSRQKACEFLQFVWTGPLRDTFFWDASLVQLNKAREFLLTVAPTPKAKREACLEARGLLGDLESREGAMGPVLELQMQVFECLDDEAGRAEVYRKLDALKGIQ